MTPALLSLADGQGTGEPHLSAIYQARLINQALGGAFVAPWNVNELPEEWLDAIMAMMIDLPGIQAGKQRINERLAEWRAKVA